MSFYRIPEQRPLYFRIDRRARLRNGGVTLVGQSGQGPPHSSQQECSRQRHRRREGRDRQQRVLQP